MKVHLDGARAVERSRGAQGLEASLAAGFDSVMTCFRRSRDPGRRGLSGSKDFIAEARRVRKLFGGGIGRWA